MCLCAHIVHACMHAVCVGIRGQDGPKGKVQVARVVVELQMHGGITCNLHGLYGKYGHTAPCSHAHRHVTLAHASTFNSACIQCVHTANVTHECLLKHIWQLHLT